MNTSNLNSIYSGNINIPYSHKKVNYGSNPNSYFISEQLPPQNTVFDSIVKKYKNIKFSKIDIFPSIMEKEAPASSFKEEKVGAVEGVSKIAQGVFGGIMTLPKLVLENPVKSLALGAGAAVLHQLIPMGGILSTAVISGLALWFGVTQISETTKDFFGAIGHNLRDEHNEQRKDLYRLGNDILLLGISAAVAPKAIKQVKKQLALMPKIGFFKEMRDEIKEVKGNVNKVKKFLTTNWNKKLNELRDPANVAARKARDTLSSIADNAGDALDDL